MISLYDRRTAKKLFDFQKEGLVKRPHSLPDEEGSPRLEFQPIDHDSGEKLYVLPGNRLLTVGQTNQLCVFDLNTGDLIYSEELWGFSEHQLLPSKHLYIKSGEYDAESVSEFAVFFNTNTYESIMLASVNDSFVDYYYQSPYLIVWRLLESQEIEKSEKCSRHTPIHLVVYNSENGKKLYSKKLAYDGYIRAPDLHESSDDGEDMPSGYDPDHFDESQFDLLDYYGEEGLQSELDWSEEDVEDYKRKQYSSYSYKPNKLEPHIDGACYDLNCLIVWNGHGFIVYDNDGCNIASHYLENITRIWPLNSEIIAIHISSYIVEFDLNTMQEKSSTPFDSLSETRPDLFLSYYESLNPLMAKNRSVVKGLSGKAQLWLDIHQSQMPIEWHSSYNPKECWFESEDKLRVENTEHRRSETVEIWYGNRKVTLAEAQILLQTNEVNPV